QVAALLAEMTLAEKIGQMTQYNASWDLTGPSPSEDGGALPYEQLKAGRVGSLLNALTVEGIRAAQQLAVENHRLNIPLIFGYDVIHGYRTMFPIPLGDAASWDVSAIETAARVAATEAAAAGLNWTFAPMVDIGRDARWGRVMEGAGEDPYLCSVVSAARVRGFQGNDLSQTDTIAACAKHFAGYGYAEGGREYNTTDISDHTLHNVILPPFRACVEAGVATFMNGFNDLNGTPVTANTYLQRELLKGAWGFDGFVVSDWASIAEMIPHGYAKDKAAAAHAAIQAGSDMDMEGHCYADHLLEQVEAGLVDIAQIDDAVKRILTVKYELGLFDDPYKYCDATRESSLLLCQEHLTLARDVAKKSIVLLKNKNNLLPLKKSGQRIAVIGPLAASKDVPLGSWRAQAITDSAVSLLEGIQGVVGDTAAIYAKGCDLAVGRRAFIFDLAINQDDTSQIPAAVALARSADVVVLAVGEDCWQSGEGRSQVDIGFAGVQQQLMEAVVAANPNVVMVLMNGRPMPLAWADQHIPAILETWHLGSEAGNAIADVLFGDYNPSGRLPVSMPRHQGQVPLYYSQKNTGRPKSTRPIVFWSHYADERNDALYPFGYGLSYTTFEYGTIQLDRSTLHMNEVLTASMEVRNTGNCTGKETIQLYIQDIAASETRPIRELKSFQQLELAAGTAQTVVFQLKAKDLAFYNSKTRTWAAEPGQFYLFIGANSRDVQQVPFELKA
ncbi:MAG: beta-glucosidase BglX, partial [Bacteroidota bacterium]